MRLLVTEDEPEMARLLQQALQEAGHAVDIATSGEQALTRVDVATYDAILLDVMLPGASGFETCRRLRARGITTPVLMLTARDDVEDRVRGLDAGADDYLGKPFSLAELQARVRALLRRGHPDPTAIITIGPIQLDCASLVARRDGYEIDLTARESAILELLMRNAGRVVSRTQLLDHAWEDEPEHNSNVIEVLIRRLREKVDRPFGSELIETVRGVGYRMRKP